MKRGQSLVEFALILFVLGIAVLVSMMLIPQSIRNMPGEAIASLVSQVEIAMDYSHAAPRHGIAATAADQCFQDHGVYETWSNPKTGRQVNICHVPDGKWFVQIIEQINGRWEEVTKFAKDKMTSYEQVAQYLRNSGYVPPQ